MSKLFNYYDNDIDYTWYNSSNIKYSECIDHENELKTLKIVFSNGTQYEYDGVNVFDYLKFREADSQGKALNQYIKAKKYEYKKLDNADLEAIDEEYVFRSGNGVFIDASDDKIALYDTKNRKIGEIEITKDTTHADVVKKLFEIVGFKVKDYIKKEDKENVGDK